MTHRKLLLAALLTAILTACGGGEWEEGPDGKLTPVDCKATPEKCR